MVETQDFLSMESNPSPASRVRRTVGMAASHLDRKPQISAEDAYPITAQKEDFIPDFQFFVESPGLGFHSQSIPSGTVVHFDSKPVVMPATPKTTFSYGAGYVAKRITAFLIDAAFVTLGVGLGFWVSATLGKIDVSTLYWVVPVFTMVVLASIWSFILLQEIVFKTSIGKMAVGLNLKGSALTVALRGVAFALGCLLFGLGPLWALIDGKNRGIHDLISGIQPEPKA